MSAMPDAPRTPQAPPDAPPCTSPLCPEATLNLGCYTCRLGSGFHRLRKRGDTCALPADVRRRRVREIGAFDGARARKLARHFGLPVGFGGMD